MAKRNLLLCFDAFGTLFRPKEPIAKQYGDVARSLGLRDITDEQVQSTFRSAFKAEAKKNPNFGKANGMDAGQWWTNIINDTFKPLIPAGGTVPSELAPTLVNRFWSNEGYELLPDALPLLRALRSTPPSHIDRLVIGVITNSDPRVPDVLASLGLHVSRLKFGGEASSTEGSTTVPYDVDFTVMSYDVGHEKPDARMFAAAEEMLQSLPAAEGTEHSAWEKVYVGDEYEKDVVGARNSGWGAVLIPENITTLPQSVQKVDGDQPGSLFRRFDSGTAAVAFTSMTQLAGALGVPLAGTG